MIRRLSDFAGLLALAAVLAVAWALTRGPAWAPATTESGLGFDIGSGSKQLNEAVGMFDHGMQGAWVRIRGIPDMRATHQARLEAVKSLQALRRQDGRSMAIFEAARIRWTSGVRQLTGSKGTVPLDLREAYERGRWLGRRYGAFVDAWEVDNEPDMVYIRDNPENYAAYLKAMYWGLKRGAGEMKARGQGREVRGSQVSAISPQVSDGVSVGAENRVAGAPRYEGGPPMIEKTADRSSASSQPSGFSSQVSGSISWNLAPGAWHLPRAPRVVMAPMALPPGPYFDALLDNDLLSYTDGFNFHYYGFEEDFPGLYAQYRAAVTAVSDKRKALSGKLEAESPQVSALSPQISDGVSAGTENRVAGAPRSGGNGPPMIEKTADRSSLSAQPSAVSSQVSALSNQHSALSPQVSAARLPSTDYRSVRLPIFISEYGNGLLSGRAAATTAGRVRQWRDFRALAGHMRALRIEASMAFILPPYLEDRAREFGLTIAPMKAAPTEVGRKEAQEGAKKREAEGGQPSAVSSQPSAASSQQSALSPQVSGLSLQPSAVSSQVSAVSSPSTVHRPPSTVSRSSVSPQVSALRPPQFSAGGLTFTPQDFGCAEPEPWMADIGRPIGGAEASPALAWMLNQPPLPEPEAWEVVVPEPSPVVLDFVAGEGLRQSKTMRGHQLMTRAGERLTGRGTVWVYNFASRPVAGAVRLEGHGGAAVDERLTLKPGERRAVPVEFAVSAGRFHGVQWRARFEADDGSVPPARLASWIYPHVGQFVPQVLADLQHAAPAAAQNAARIDARPLARGEAPLFPQGRWRVTKGVTVEEHGDTWRFTVTEFPDEVMRPAMAELPLPDGFRFPRYSMILAQLRLAPRRAEEVRAHPEPRGEPENSALDREVFGLYFRTAQGGLYVTTMNFAATTEWLNFGQVADNFTPFFYGRIHLPWRFLENEPAALALVFRPRLLPATYEVRGAKIVELTAGSDKR